MLMLVYATAYTSKVGINRFSGYPLNNGNFDRNDCIQCLQNLQKQPLTALKGVKLNI
jgi:hypothetical protein